METLTLFSSIKPELLQKQLMRGTVVAAVGSVLLLCGGIWIPKVSMGSWGLFLFLVAMGLIAIGMMPYRRLKYRESHPFVVKIQNNIMYCYSDGKQTCQVDMSAIDSIEYVDDERRYGIRIHVVRPQKGTVFLPYFSKNSLEQIKAQRPD